MAISKLTSPVKPNDIIKKVNEVIDSDELKAPIATTVTNVSYNSSSNKIQKTINGSTTDVSTVVTSVNGSSGAVTVTADNTFIAVRNTTTYAEITSALTAGKIIFATLNSNRVIPTAVLVGTQSTGSVSSYIFTSISGNSVLVYTVNDSNVWSESTITLAKDTDLTSVTLNGTATKTPSFYAPTTAGTTGYYLKSSGSGAPVWGEAPGGGGSTVGYTPNLTAGAEAGTITIDSVDTKIYVPNVAYATSDSQDRQLTATVAGSQPFTLTTGAIVVVKFTYDKAFVPQYPMTLNVNSTGAKAVICNGITMLAATTAYVWKAGDSVVFVYDGTNWQWIGKERYASTSDYGIVKLSTATNSVSDETAATSSAVKAAYDLANGKSAVTLNGTASATPSFYAPTTAGTSGYVLTSTGSGAPTWAAAPSGGGGVLVVNVEEDDGVCTADKTYAQIMAAINNGQDVYAVLWMYVYQLDQINTEDNFVSFSYVGFYNQYVGDERMFVDTITIDASSVTRDIQLQSGSSGSALVVHLTFDDGEVYSDKTYSQIVTAISAEQLVYATDGLYIYSFDSYDTEENRVYFARTEFPHYNGANDNRVMVYTVCINANSNVAYTEITDSVPASASVSNGTITFKDASNNTLFNVALPIYNGGVQTV